MLSKFEKFCRTIATLRGPQGCPWDREQTHKTLTRYLLEETYEVLDAINTNEFGKLKEELGDLLLQIVLQSQLASEEGKFNLEEVIEAIDKKMIARHPHVFSDKKITTSQEVLNQWEELKDAEKLPNNKRESALANIPSGLPALLKALKVSEKAVNKGFEWEKEEDIWQQLESEIEEFKHEAAKQKLEQSKVQEQRKSAVASEELYLEMGDMLFTLVNIACWYKIDPEEALLLTVEKFKTRFQLMEKNAKVPLNELTVGQLDHLWQSAKHELIKNNTFQAG